MRFAVLAFRTSMQTLNNDACQLFGSWDSVLYENRAQNLKSTRYDEDKEHEVFE